MFHRTSRWVGLAFALTVAVGCQHEKLRVDDGEVKGPGYRLKIPDGFEVGAADVAAVEKLGGHLVLLVSTASDPGPIRPAIVHTDVGPSSKPTASRCTREAEATREERAKTLAQEVDLSGVELVEDANLGRVCRFHLHYRGDKRHGAFRLFKVMLDGSTVACSTAESDGAEALCDGYLAGFRAPSRFD